MTTLPQTTPMRVQRPAGALAIPTAMPVLAQPAPFSMTGNDVVRVLRANVWLIAAFVVIGGLSGWGINTWLADRYPRYAATENLKVMTPAEIPHPGEVFASGSNGGNVDLEAKEQITKIYRGELPLEVLSGALLPGSDAVRRTSWFKQFQHVVDGRPMVDIEGAKQALLDELDVSRVPDSRLLAVTFSCAVPEDCKTIVEAICEQHIADQREARRLDVKNQSDQLEHMQSDSQAELTEIQGHLAKVMKLLSDAGQPLQGRGLTEDQLAQLIAEQVRANTVLAEVKLRSDAFEREFAATGTTRTIEDVINSNGKYQQKQRAVDDLTIELATTRDTLGEANQKVVSLQKLLTMFKQELGDIHESIRKDTAQRMHEQLTGELIEIQRRAADLNKQVDAMQGRLSNLADLQNQYVRLLSDERDAREKLAKLKDTVRDIDNWNPNGYYATVSEYTKPQVPTVPTFPRLVNTMTMSIGLALFLALGIAFLREVTDTSVRSPRDIARVGQLNLLGMIPHQDDDPQAAGARLPLLIMEAPHSMIAEQFRQVRTRLQHAASLDTTRSILVTGCSPGDGKTTVACNLAAGLALNGRRILLVDANFRKPQLHQIFNLDNELGFGDVLTSPEAFAQAIHETIVPNLSVLVLGNKPQNSTELLESQLLIDFIERSLLEFDHVIFDSGPLLIVSETVGLAPRVDGVVTVVRAVGSSRGILQRLRDQLRQLKAEHLGVILNAVRVQGGGYYGPLIKSYYAYQDGTGPFNRANGVHTNGSNGVHANGANGVETNGVGEIHPGATNGSYANGANGSNGSGAHGSNGSDAGANGHG